MLFNSINFAFFLPIVLLGYWLVRKKYAYQNFLLLIASYFFYSCWDWRFLFLLVFSTALDYYSGIIMSTTVVEKKRKFWFWLSIGVNLGFLGVFKYYNFFIDSFSEILLKAGVHVEIKTLSIILPVGISFYTFHGLSYVIDIYKRRIIAERNFIDYSLFVSFFPLLVAGPIERATHLLPQLKKERKFDYLKAVDGLRQILWGLFKKMVIADNCAEYANLIFNNSGDYSGISLFIGAVFFTFQIYGDFSGYSDIAIGTAKLFGIDLLKNFNFPYFSRDIAEFWRRWHISLSTWFRDYLYIPLGGSQVNKWQKIRNTFVIFIVSGFWHGANWTFVFWGVLNAFYFIPLLLKKKNRTNLDIVANGKMFPSLIELFNISKTFILVVIGWIFFRSNNLSHAFSFIKEMLLGLFSKQTYVEALNLIHWKIGYILPLLIVFFYMLEWIGREGNHALENLGLRWNKRIRISMYYVFVLLIYYFGGNEQEFIYFQF
jgi:alginate O-acetyltransferase complex protein AlgI